MKFILKTFFVLLAASSTSFAGWIATISDHPLNAGDAYIRYKPALNAGLPTFIEALRQLAAAGQLARLQNVDLSELLDDNDFQKELFAILERTAPRELQEALRSAGNMHNPKMYQLQDPFVAALQQTRLVQQINRDLVHYDLEGRAHAVEKFQLDKTVNPPRFFCMTIGLEIKDKGKGKEHPRWYYSIPTMAQRLGTTNPKEYDPRGLVCVDPLPRTGSWEGNRTGATTNSVFSVQIDDSAWEIISAGSCGAFSNLDLNANHLVTIQLEGQPYAAFHFNFRKVGGEHLRLWYYPMYGTWQL